MVFELALYLAEGAFEVLEVDRGGDFGGEVEELFDVLRALIQQTAVKSLLVPQQLFVVNCEIQIVEDSVEEILEVVLPE